MHTIVVTTALLPKAFTDTLQQFGEVRLAHSYQGELWAGVTIVLTTVMDAMHAEQIAQLPDSVQLIANIGVGTDNIDLTAAAARGIQVSNTPVVTEDTADLAMGLLLDTCRRMSAGERYLRADQWMVAQGKLGSRVHSKKLGIVGFGDIGQALARRAKGFNMEIFYWGPRRKPEAETTYAATYIESLEELVASVDIVSLNCPLTEQTQHIVDAPLLEKFQAHSVLINTGRGPLIDEQALIAALQAGKLAAAGLDVFENEPEVPAALKAMDNVVLTPHIGSATAECRGDMVRRAAGNIAQYVKDGTLIDRVA